LQLVECGELDRLWRMLFDLESGHLRKSATADGTAGRPALSSIKAWRRGGVLCGTMNPGWLLRRDPGLRDASPLGLGGGERDKDGAGGIGNLRFQDLKGGAEGEIMKDEL